jgi:hypothetical protein
VAPVIAVEQSLLLSTHAIASYAYEHPKSFDMLASSLKVFKYFSLFSGPKNF